MAQIRLDKLRKSYGNHEVVHGVDLKIEDGEFLVLVGPSGCGKSTLLRMIAGLEEVTSGTLRIGEATVNALPPANRNIAMVFQDYALYPHMSVADSMAFGLKMRNTPSAEIRSASRQRRKRSRLLHCSSACPVSSRAASDSELRWDERSCVSPRRSFSTSRSLISMRRCGLKCAWKWRGCIDGCGQRPSM